MIKPIPVNVEVLEDRCTPATWGNPWPDAGHVTLSFAPDGTPVSGQTSRLFGSLDASMPRDVWQREVLRAFQTWAVNANINIGLVADGGQTFGTAGSVQGDTRFGDVRVGAFAQAADALASASPYEVTSGTWAGDVRINSSLPFTSGGSSGHDLTTVLMQEAGHAFGLDNSPDSASVMYEWYSGLRTGLSAGDVAALQALYGARTPDEFEGSGGNNTLSTATPLGWLADASGSLSMTKVADITTAADRDVFSFTTPLSLGSLVVKLRTSGLSLLTGRLSVYNAQGNLVQSTAAVDPRSGDLVLRVDGLNLLSKYRVMVEGSGNDVFRMGSYLLEVQYLPLLHPLLGSATNLTGSAVDTVTGLLAQNDLHTNDSIFTATALPLQQILATTSSRIEYTFRGAVSDSWDKDFYRLIAPTTSAGSTQALTVMVWGTPSRLQPNQFLTPIVNVYDGLGNRCTAEVLVNDGRTLTVQVANATPGATYFVEVKAANPTQANNTGNYFLGVDFSPKPVTLQTLAQGQVTSTTPRQNYSLTVDMSSRFHFVLSANGAVGSSVRMLIYDLSGRMVFALRAAAGQSVSGGVYLKKGTYHVVFVGSTTNGGPLPALDYVLKGARLSDNNGPETVDPTGDPSGTSMDPTPTPSNGGSGSGGVPSPEPYDDPYTAEDETAWYYWDGETWHYSPPP